MRDTRVARCGAGVWCGAALTRLTTASTAPRASGPALHVHGRRQTRSAPRVRDLIGTPAEALSRGGLGGGGGGGQVTVKNDEDASNFDDYDDADGPDANAAYPTPTPPPVMCCHVLRAG